MLGIIGALKIEVDSLKEEMDYAVATRISGMDFYAGKLMGKDVIVAVAGVGKVNAALCAQTMILKYGVDCIINTGVAGGTRSDVSIGDIVIATQLVQHDMDTTSVGDPLGYISGDSLNRIEIPTTVSVSDKLLNYAKDIEDIKVFKGVIASGDQFINDNDKIKWLRETFDTHAVDMESASIGMVCFVNDVDCGIIRSISDSGDDNSHMDFPTFSKLAAKNALQLLHAYIKEL